MPLANYDATRSPYFFFSSACVRAPPFDTLRAERGSDHREAYDHLIITATVFVIDLLKRYRSRKIQFS